MYCEYEEDYQNSKANKKSLSVDSTECINKFMGKVLNLIKGDIILCLGKASYNNMIKLASDSKYEKLLKDKKILGIYHPSGYRGWKQKYFKDDKDKHINPSYIREIKEFIREDKNTCWLG